MYFKVTLNGVTLKRWLDRQEADEFAERWQGSHGGYRGGYGLLKHKDKRDYVEVKEDREANREYEERLKVAKAGDRQVINYEQRVEQMSDADPAMRRG